MSIQYLFKNIRGAYQSLYVDGYLQQNNVIKAREEKYLSRIRVLETLAIGTSEESQVFVWKLVCAS